MDHLTAAVLATGRDHRDDLAFSALPEAPRRPTRRPSRIRRALGHGLLAAAHRVEPTTRAEPTTRPQPQDRRPELASAGHHVR